MASAGAAIGIKAEKMTMELIEALTRLSQEHPGYGFWKLYHKLRSLDIFGIINGFIGFM